MHSGDVLFPWHHQEDREWARSSWSRRDGFRVRWGGVWEDGVSIIIMGDRSQRASIIIRFCWGKTVV